MDHWQAVLGVVLELGRQRLESLTAQNTVSLVR